MKYEQPCSLDDLEALIPRWDRWMVDENGVPKEFSHPGEGSDDADDIEEFGCSNCGEYFTPKNRWDRSALTEPWQRAIDHLPAVGTIGRRIVRVEVAA